MKLFSVSVEMLKVPLLLNSQKKSLSNSTTHCTECVTQKTLRNLLKYRCNIFTSELKIWLITVTRRLLTAAVKMQWNLTIQDGTLVSAIHLTLVSSAGIFCPLKSLLNTFTMYGSTIHITPVKWRLMSCMRNMVWKYFYSEFCPLICWIGSIRLSWWS